jgi:hypothetical protein
MITKTMKWLSIIALLPAALFLWQPPADYRLVLQFVVCGTAALVALQAGRESKYLWAAGFWVVAVLFNPLAPIAVSHNTFVWLNLLSAIMLLASLVYLKNPPRLTIASVTDPGARSESL